MWIQINQFVVETILAVCHTKTNRHKTERDVEDAWLQTPFDTQLQFG